MRRPFPLSPQSSVLVFCFVLTGCLATSQELEDLRVDINRYHSALDKAAARQAEFQEAQQGNQADLLSQMSSLSPLARRRRHRRAFGGGGACPSHGTPLSGR